MDRLTECTGGALLRPAFMWLGRKFVPEGKIRADGLRCYAWAQFERPLSRRLRSRSYVRGLSWAKPDD